MYYYQSPRLRPIKSIIRSHLRRPLAKKIVAGEVKEGDHIDVVLENGEILWIKQTEPITQLA
ncbi:hypothetical protein H8R25_00980 [Flavobacterium sp. F-392]|uniref:Clp ATPase C-terminal domain-containing protein n=1 Tax=Flavobacterium muglaense TaxID=2764716 RepID=A0A923SES7_9FLAO|nr:hypothetical protein [Flavobacterium muglaense]MBC5843014.1 hypothetical protein [Flavobacterium muglaense]